MKGKSSLPNTQVNGLTVAMYPGGQDTVSWGAVWRVEREGGEGRNVTTSLAETAGYLTVESMAIEKR